MKKLFLIPLLAMLCTVMAWGATVQVADFAALRSAVASANDGDVIELTQDMEFRSETALSCVDIRKSITIDGKGFSIVGYARRQNNEGGRTNGTLIAINNSPTQYVDVTIKNLTLINERLRAIETRGYIHSLTIDNCTIEAKRQAGTYDQPITIGGNQSSVADITIKNSTIKAAKYYPIVTFNPVNMTITDSKIQGWSSVYFKGVDGSEGSHGSTLTATNTYFDAQNIYSGNSNSFGAFPLEDDGIDIVLDNCVLDVTAHDQSGVAKQSVFLLSSWSDRQEEACSIKIKGANSHIIGQFIDITWNNVPQDIAFTLEGGSYYGADYLTAMEDTHVSIATGFHAEQVSQGGQVLYRIVKDAAEKTPGVMYDLNDYVPVEGVDEGNNPISSFDLSTGDDMVLNNEVTTAGYVEIKDHATEGATTVTVGQTAGGDDQTLIINNGLDVQGNSQVIVEPGATLQIGKGGIVTEQPENIVIEANENGAASMIMDPAITVNTMPNLTVRMTAKQIGRNADNDYFWHRFAMPVASITSWDKEGALGEGNDKYPTYLYAWDYANNDWANIAPNAMEPLQGYTLTLASEYIDGAATDGHLNVLQDVVYTFKGNLVGNTDQPLNFQHEGFNFFGNSYTGYMDVKTMLQGLEDGHIDGTAYMWNTDEQIYVGVSLLKLIKGRGLENWQKEVAPMQTFILRLRGADTANEEVNYAAAIWGNPNRYGNNGGSSPAPRRRVADINEDTYMEIAVKAANGKTSRVDFTESANNSDAFESGYDVEKYMNEKTINLYASVNGMNLSSVVTDNIEGKTLSLQTNGEIAYTMSFKNVEGTEYAIRDNVTGTVIAIEEGATYEFAAQPNSTIEGRFEIVSRANMPTAIENTEVRANVKGIYTIMGQYLGEDFDILPAGVYVVDGVKIVK